MRRHIMLSASSRSPCSPNIIILNDPEVGRHPFTWRPRASASSASRSTRSVSISHSERLIGAFGAEVSLCEIRLTKQLEETHIREQTRSFWVWPKHQRAGGVTFSFRLFTQPERELGSHMEGSASKA